MDIYGSESSILSGFYISLKGLIEAGSLCDTNSCGADEIILQNPLFNVSFSVAQIVYEPLPPPPPPLQDAVYLYNKRQTVSYHLPKYLRIIKERKTNNRLDPNRPMWIRGSGSASF